MTLTNEQEQVLNTLIAAGRRRIDQEETAETERNRNTRQKVIAAFQIPDSLQEFVIAGKPIYEFGNHFIWLRIPTLLPIKLTFYYAGERDYYSPSSCTVMHGEESHYCTSLNEALAVAQELSNQPIPPAAQKIDEDTINAAYDELERTTRNAHQFDPDREWAPEIAELKVRRIAAILNFRTKDVLLERYRTENG